MKRATGSLVLVIGTLLSLALMGGVYALWSATTATGGTAGVRAAALGAGNQPDVGVLGTAVEVSWAPTELPDGEPVAAYEVSAHDATSGAARAVAGTCAGLISTTSCTDLAVPSGTWRYRVVPREASWTGIPSPLSGTATVDSTPPDVAMSFPIEGGAYTNTLWNAGCAGVGGAGVCGTASDALTGLATVRVSVRRASTGLYWNGSSYSSATEVLLTPIGTSSWRLALSGSSFPGEGTYVARVVATDTSGNSASTSTTFAIDRSAPTISIVDPPASTTFGRGEWDAACGVCGSASDAISAVANVRVSIRQGSSTYWDGSAFASPTEVPFTANGTTAWSLPFASSAFPANGTYTVRAVAADMTGATAQQTRSFTMDVTGPTPSALALVNGGGTAGLGRINPGSDSLRITFGERLAVSSICSSWSGDTANQSATAVVTVTDVGANDELSVAAPGCPLHVGTVSLGGDYVSATATFGGTVTWTVSSRRITITIGSQTGGTLATVAATAGTAVYAPDGAITDVEGNPVSTAAFAATGQRL